MKEIKATDFTLHELLGMYNNCELFLANDKLTTAERAEILADQKRYYEAMTTKIPEHIHKQVRQMATHIFKPSHDFTNRRMEHINHKGLIIEVNNRIEDNLWQCSTFLGTRYLMVCYMRTATILKHYKLLPI